MRKIALLDTSVTRKKKILTEPVTVETEASPRLLELLDQGYEVYIVTTRTKLFKDGHDKCLFDLIQEENFFTPDPELGCGGPDSPGLVDLWKRAVTHVGVKLDDCEDDCENLTWMCIRHLASKQGVTIT